MPEHRFAEFTFWGRPCRAALMFASFFLLLSCGSGGGSNSNGLGDSNSATLQQGVFIDSAVQGLNYRTASRVGVTDQNGTFRYLPGEQVSFLIGDLELGQGEGQALFSPLDLVTGVSDISDPAVTNICRLLQSLDADGNPNNGIELPDVVHAAMTGRAIDFSIDPNAFSSDPEIFALLAELNAQGIFPDETRTLVSATQARNHLQASLGQGGNNDEPPGASAETSFESSLRTLINSYRTQSGLAPLTFSSALYQLAQQHSTAMQASDDLNHLGFQERYADSGYRSCVENVAWNYQTPASLLAGWQNSAGHDLNLLNENIGFAGISKVGAYSTFFACGD